jgi:hypothetical protein
MSQARHRAPRSQEVADIASARSVPVRGHQVGTLVDWTDEGPRVDYPGNPHGPLLARSFVARPASPPAGQPVLLVFEDERSHRPVLVGLAPSTAPLEAVVDGQRVVLEGREEIVLRCGKASITLRRNGRVVVRGTYVESRSEGVNRIKGGTVRIN